MTWTELRFARNGPVELAHDRLQQRRNGEPLLLVMGLAVSRLAVARLCASPGYPFDEAEALERISADVDTGIADPDAQSRQIGARWSGPPLSELRVPTLVLHGTDDPLLKPSAGRATAAAIHDARLVLQPGVGHDIPRERHAAVAAEVRALADRAKVGGRP
ncbi:alpha/beta fold hydrolase [Streptomyces sp. NPDC058629]|uniref:alpha/beta fold hydrolase n=1 Tax=Streptomyces sp. NPDC058629 TaxID=3346565 RepID=UPI00365176F9